MQYHVYRKSSNGFKLLASTRYLQDATSILSRWHIGYITDQNGDLVVEKNT